MSKRKSVVRIAFLLCFFIASLPVLAPGTEAFGKDVSLKVSNLSVKSSSYDYITLKWRAVPGATGYKIYRSKEKTSGYKLVKTISTPSKESYRNTKLSQSTTYYYKVKVINGSGYSNIVKKATEKKRYSNQRTTVAVSKLRDGTSISWTRLNSIDGYRVYRSYDGKKYTRIAQVNKNITTFFDNKAASGRKCYYKVRGYRGFFFKKYTAYSFRKKMHTVTRVYIACGHGTDILGHWDTGCTYKGLTEAGLMLPITKSFVKYARKSGVYVYTDADAGNNKNMIACVRAANKQSLSAYISVHCDYYKAKSGTLPLYKSAQDRKLAEKLNSGVRSQVTIPTRGLSRRVDLYELNMTKAASCIFETGSIKNDKKTLQKKFDIYGKGLAKGLCEYLGVAFAG